MALCLSDFVCLPVHIIVQLIHRALDDLELRKDKVGQVILISLNVQK